jgi:hypothetical protein
MVAAVHSIRFHRQPRADHTTELISTVDNVSLVDRVTALKPPRDTDRSAATPDWSSSTSTSVISTATSPASNCRGPAPRYHQPHRPGRDYTGIGPVRFAEPAYRSTIRATAQ